MEPPTLYEIDLEHSESKIRIFLQFVKYEMCEHLFLGQIFLSTILLSFPPLPDFDDEVAGHSRGEEADEDPELDVNAEVRLEHVGQDEAERLPEAVVAEPGSGVVSGEEGAVQGWGKNKSEGKGFIVYHSKWSEI